MLREPRLVFLTVIPYLIMSYIIYYFLEVISIKVKLNNVNQIIKNERHTRKYDKYMWLHSSVRLFEVLRSLIKL